MVVKPIVKISSLQQNTLAFRSKINKWSSLRKIQTKNQATWILLEKNLIRLSILVLLKDMWAMEALRQISKWTSTTSRSKTNLRQQLIWITKTEKVEISSMSMANLGFLIPVHLALLNTIQDNQCKSNKILINLYRGIQLREKMKLSVKLAMITVMNRK